MLVGLGLTLVIIMVRFAIADMGQHNAAKLWSHNLYV